MDKPALLSYIATLNTLTLVFAVVTGLGAVGGTVLGIVSWRANLQLRRLDELDAQAQQLAIETAKRDAALASERAAEANQKAEEERLARIKIEQQLAPRMLTTAEQAAVAAKLAPLAPMKIHVISIVPGDEVVRFSKQVIEALRGANWEVPSTPITLMGGSLSGITLNVSAKASDEERHAANALVNVLREQHITIGDAITVDDLKPPLGAATGDSDSMFQDARLQLVIGPK